MKNQSFVFANNTLNSNLNRRSAGGNFGCHLLGWLLLALTALPAQAQTGLKINPTGLALGTGSVSLEHFLVRRLSVQADGYLTYRRHNDLLFSGGGGGLSVRYYLMAVERPRGIFLSPMWYWQRVSFDDLRQVRYTYSFNAAGGQVGYQMVWGRIGTAELGVGVLKGLNVPTLSAARGVDSLHGAGFFPFLNLAVGLHLPRLVK